MAVEPLQGTWPPAPLIFEIYPRSFQDSNGDGIGDLPGILRRVDYLSSLGADAVWICPFMPSPWVDGGYDVSDYCDIHPSLGTLEDWDALVEALHKRRLRVMVDLVLNHTSDKHPWYEKSADREPGFADHYVWRDAKPDGAPPTNWIGRFGDQAWSWDHRREQYVLHNYLAQQPSLNLRCPNVQKDIAEIFAFWRSHGVDGFRLDAVTSYLCDPDFRDNPPASDEARAKMDGEPFLPYVRQDHLHDFLPGDGAAYCEHLRSWAGSETYLLGEVGTGNQSVEVSNDFTGPSRLNAGYVVDIPQFGFTANVVEDILSRRKGAQTLAWWTGSHDRARQPNGPDDPLTRFQLMFLAMMPGPALLYQGQELGLPQPHLEKNDVTDPYDLQFWPDGPGREGARVPIPWEERDERNGTAQGFSTARPWLPMRWPEGASIASQEAENTPLAFTRTLLAIRKKHGLSELPEHEVQRKGELLWIRYPTLNVCLNFSSTDKALPNSHTALLLATSPGSCTSLPPKSGAIWATSNGEKTD